MPGRHCCALSGCVLLHHTFRVPEHHVGLSGPQLYRQTRGEHLHQEAGNSSSSHIPVGTCCHCCCHCGTCGFPIVRLSAFHQEWGRGLIQNFMWWKSTYLHFIVFFFPGASQGTRQASHFERVGDGLGKMRNIGSKRCKDLGFRL